jgi:hypothetical protein
MANFTLLPVYSWLSLRAGLDVIEKRKLSSHFWESNTDSLAVQSGV